MNSDADDDLQYYSWYIGGAKRRKAEQILLENAREIGTFLVRKTLPHTYPPKYRISVLTCNETRLEVIHYKILMHDDTYHIYNNRLFLSIPELVNWYLENTSNLAIPFTIPYLKSDENLLEFQNSLSMTSFSKPMKIDQDQIESVDKICCTRFSKMEIWKGILQPNSQIIVSKFSSQTSASPESFKRLKKEAKILNSLNHKNIIRIIGVVSYSGVYSIITPYQENKDLLSYLLGYDQYEVSTSQFYQMAIDIGEGLSYIETMNCVHRNLRASNVLVDKNITCKVSGFGHAVRLNSDGTYFATDVSEEFDHSSFRWMALESALEGNFSSASDVWSYAVLTFEVFTKGELPYSDILTPSVVKMVDAGHRLSRFPGIPIKLFDVMTNCWNRNRTLRPSIKEIIIFLQECLKANKINQGFSS